MCPSPFPWEPLYFRRTPGSFAPYPNLPGSLGSFFFLSGQGAYASAAEKKAAFCTIFCPPSPSFFGPTSFFCDHYRMMFFGFIGSPDDLPPTLEDLLTRWLPWFQRHLKKNFLPRGAFPVFFFFFQTFFVLTLPHDPVFVFV